MDMSLLHTTIRRISLPMTNPPKKIIHIFSIEYEHWFFFFFSFLNAEFQPKHHIVAEEYYIKYWKLDSKKKKLRHKKNEKWKELKKWVLEMVRNREMLPEREEKRRWDFVEEIGFDTHQTHCQFNKYLVYVWIHVLNPRLRFAFFFFFFHAFWQNAVTVHVLFNEQ